MDDREFVAKSDACLGRVAKWLEDFDPDEVDYATSDGSVTLEFPDGAKYHPQPAIRDQADLARGRLTRVSLQLRRIA